MIASVLVFCLVAIVTLASSVRSGINSQASARSDNTQFTLSQLDVEYLSFKETVAKAAKGSGSLTELRKRFDIFYSRTETFETSKVFAQMREDAVFSAGLAAVRGFLQKYVTAIDGSDTQLRAALPEIDRASDDLRPKLKDVSRAGLNMFAISADQQRRKIFDTLTQVGALTALMIVLLTALVGMLLHFDRINRERAHELELNAKRTRSIVETATDAVIVVDSEGLVQEFNPAAERIFNYARNDTLGKSICDLVIPAGSREARFADIANIQTGRFSAFEGQGRLRLTAQRNSGEEFPAEMSVSKSQDAMGTIYIAFLRDLSAEVAAEKELLSARDKALAGEKAKADLLAVMGHEMRTPLNGMLGMLELCRETSVTARQKALLDVMKTSGELLLHHVNDVLSISRLESGKMHLSLTPTNLPNLINGIIANQSTISKSNGNTVNVTMTAQVPRVVKTDAFQLRHVLLNLINNAVKFTRGGIITVACDFDMLTEQLKIKVSDTGIGIAAADIDRVFEDFVTLDASYARSEGGTGLGLGITRRFVKNLGGEISAESTEGVGSTFSLSLPAKPSQEEHVEEQSTIIPTFRRPLRVLLVEDNAINRMVVRELLAKHGHEIDEACDGEEGVQKAGLVCYDLILMDISMPLMDGVTATKLIRSGSGLSKDVPIFALTAHALPYEISSFLAAGMQEVLVKPVSRDVLTAALSRVPLRHSTEIRPEDARIDEQILAQLFETVGEAQSRELMNDFIAHVDQTIASLLACDEPVENKDDLRRDIHNLCGSAANFGAKDFSITLRSLEELCRQNHPDQALTGLRDAIPQWHATRSNMQEYQYTESV